MQTGNYDIEQIMMVFYQLYRFDAVRYCSDVFGIVLFWGDLEAQTVSGRSRSMGSDFYRQLVVMIFPLVFDHSINLLIFCSKQRLLSMT